MSTRNIQKLWKLSDFSLFVNAFSQRQYNKSSMSSYKMSIDFNRYIYYTSSLYYRYRYQIPIYTYTFYCFHLLDSKTSYEKDSQSQFYMRQFNKTLIILSIRKSACCFHVRSFDSFCQHAIRLQIHVCILQQNFNKSLRKTFDFVCTRTLALVITFAF